MPKIGSVWEKFYEDKDGNAKERHSGVVTIDGLEFYLDLYPKSSTNPKSPSFDVYLKEAKPKDRPAF